MNKLMRKLFMVTFLTATFIIIVVFPTSATANIHCAVPEGAHAISDCIESDGSAVIGPSAGPDCDKVRFDRSYTGMDALKRIIIESGGEVYINDRNLQIELEAIEISGLFQVGTKKCPIGTMDIGHNVMLTFQGARPCESPEQCDGFHKGILVKKGGTLRLFGLKGVPASELHGGDESGISWTHLEAPAGPTNEYGKGSGALAPVRNQGETTLRLARDVTVGPGAWQVGDWIAVATTGFSSVETEIVQISKFTNFPYNDLDLTDKDNIGAIIKQPLKHYHFGSPNPGEPSLTNFNDCSGYNYGVDERAEVALLSRNIKLTSEISDGENNLHWGGEIRILNGFSEVSIQGVEIEKFGKDQLASYPIHFHQDGDVSSQKPLINANSIHHSYNKCITLHSSSNLTIENNACIRIVGHIFYQENGDEEGIRYLNNLGLGAMSNSFYISADSEEEKAQKIKNYWWSGDHLGQPGSSDYIGYDGFNIPNTDSQDNPVRGVCARRDPNTENLILTFTPYLPPNRPGKCNEDEIYFEPASGFWIINPGTELIGNSIGGCQDVGRGYWYVPPKNRPDAGVPEELTKYSLKPVGTFRNNRVHSCYSGLYGEEEFGVFSEQLFPREGATSTGKNIIATFDGLTSTRNRDRGVWLRPVWFVLKNGRFATNRNSVTLVSSGGLDGNAPGVWSVLHDSVVVGVSLNNVDRWGPCPFNSPNIYECFNPDKPSTSAPNSAKGFPSPFFNLSGYMIYDGPIRIERNRFVNFNRDVTQHLTNADKEFLESYTNYPNGNNPNVYEGDAALGWFQNNQSAYPTGTESRDLSWDNVDLRHQIYTERVNFGDFQDGDQNTAIIDLDGTLTGFKVVDIDGNSVPGAHPISLNNLEFNHASNSVDECLAEGQQDEAAEGRPTSLISAGSYATLEFQNLFPPPLPTNPIKQSMTFVKDEVLFGEHSDMVLTSRNGLGVWEPKVASGYGYTVGASTCDTAVGTICSEDSGISDRVLLGITDAIKPVIDEDSPFYVRLGICYTNLDGSHPADDFTITRGYRSWGGNGTNVDDRDLQKYFNVLQNRYQNQTCHNLEFQNSLNRDPATGCPAAGITPVPDNGNCPAPSAQGTNQQGNPACIYPKTTLTAAANIDELTLPDGSPDLTKYFYDAARGLLFLYVAQTLSNPLGPSPLGDCAEGGSSDDNPYCPELAEGESYYACPAPGCIDYLVQLNDATYDPGPSNCDPYPTYEQNPPNDELLIAHIETGEIIQPVEEGGKDGDFPHTVASTEPDCKLTEVDDQTALAELVPASLNKAINYAIVDGEEVPGPVRCPPTSENSGISTGGCNLIRPKH